MEIAVPDRLMGGIRLTRQEALLDFAIGVFIDRKATLEQAAGIASLSQPEFLKELGKRKVPVHYDAEDVDADLKAIDEL